LIALTAGLMAGIAYGLIISDFIVALANVVGAFVKTRRSGTLRYGSRCTHDEESGIGRTAFSGDPMNEDRIAGTARNIGGTVEEGVGRITGDTEE
jgi:hypothetical protein